jgi:hypothetical protein
MTDPTTLGVYLTAGASMLAALALLFTGFVTLRGQAAVRRGVSDLSAGQQIVSAQVADANAQLATTNGIAPGLMLERQEGRRVLAAKPDPAARTTSEQGYVDLVDTTGRNIGHTEATDKTIVPGEVRPTTQAERDLRPGAATP